MTATPSSLFRAGQNETALFADEKSIVMRSVAALLFGYAKYTPHYPNPSPHRSFSGLGL
jgi:hypothetical protein